jgi:probable rRNA maturation factor|uniref:rRNA maturation RNase YbeY n=1 Tax=Cyanobium sp. TaxID=2164130 RepID=UPI00404B5678
MSIPAGSIDLDLAFQTGDDLPPALWADAQALVDPLAGSGTWADLLSHWLGQLQAELPPPLQAGAYCLGLSLVSDAEIAELNQDWRQKQGPTDVLAFAAQETMDDDDGTAFAPMPLPPEFSDDDSDLGPEALELGDIVISIETAARQAPDHGHSLARELQFLASHGLLHLLGWDHPDDASLQAMLARQDQLLAGAK